METDDHCDQDMLGNIVESAEINAVIADIGSYFACSSYLFVEKLMIDNKKLKSERKYLLSKLRYSKHIFDKAKLEVENLKCEFENYKKRGVFQLQCLQIEKAKNEMANRKVQILTEDYANLLREHELLKNKVHSAHDKNRKYQPGTNATYADDSLCISTVKYGAGPREKDKLAITTRRTTKEFENIDQNNNSISLDPYEVKDLATESFKIVCNSSLQNLEAYMSTLQNSLDVTPEEDDTIIAQEKEYKKTGSDFIQDNKDTVYQEMEGGTNTNNGSIDKRIKTCKGSIIVSKCVGEVKKLTSTKTEMIDVLEKVEIVEVIADVSSQFAVSSCSFIVKVMRENEKLRARHRSLISKAKQMKHDFERAKREIQSIKRKLELNKKRDIFGSRLTDIDKIKNNMVNMKLQVLLDDVASENKELKEELCAANVLVDKYKSEVNDKCKKESNADSMIIENTKTTKDEENIAKEEVVISARELASSAGSIKVEEEGMNSISLSHYEQQTSSTVTSHITIESKSTIRNLDEEREKRNSIALSHYEQRQSSTDKSHITIESLCNSTIRELDSILLNFEVESDLKEEDDDVFDSDITKEALNGSIFFQSKIENMDHSSYINMNNVDSSIDSPTYIQNKKNKIQPHTIVNVCCDPSKISDLLEIVEIEKVVSDISSKFAISFCRLAKEVMDKNGTFSANNPSFLYSNKEKTDQNTKTSEHVIVDDIIRSLYTKNKSYKSQTVYEGMSKDNLPIKFRYPTQMNDLLENEEIEKIVVDILSQYAVSSYIIYENEQLKANNPIIFQNDKKHFHQNVEINEEVIDGSLHSAPYNQNKNEDNQPLLHEMNEGNLLNKSLNQSDMRELLENAEIEEVVADVLCRFTVSNCTLIENILKENGNLKAKHTYFIKKTKIVKHDFERAKHEMENIKYEIETNKNQEGLVMSAKEVDDSIENIKFKECEKRISIVLSHCDYSKYNIYVKSFQAASYRLIQELDTFLLNIERHLDSVVEEEDEADNFKTETVEDSTHLRGRREMRLQDADVNRKYLIHSPPILIVAGIESWIFSCNKLLHQSSHEDNIFFDCSEQSNFRDVIELAEIESIVSDIVFNLAASSYDFAYQKMIENENLKVSQSFLISKLDRYSHDLDQANNEIEKVKHNLLVFKVSGSQSTENEATDFNKQALTEETEKERMAISLAGRSSLDAFSDDSNEQGEKIASICSTTNSKIHTSNATLESTCNMSIKHLEMGVSDIQSSVQDRDEQIRKVTEFEDSLGTSFYNEPKNIAHSEFLAGTEDINNSKMTCSLSGLFQYLRGTPSSAPLCFNF